MVPLGALVDVQRASAARIAACATTCSRRRTSTAAPLPGVSSGAGDRRDRKRLARNNCPDGMFVRVDRSRVSGNSGRQHRVFVFPLCVVLVFLVLAAQYESWSLPLAVILIVPMCLLVRDRRRCGRGLRHQHLHAGRFRRAGRAGVQERHPASSSSPSELEMRDRSPARSSPRGGLPAAAAADPDDHVRVHPGRGAAGPGAAARVRKCGTTLGMAVLLGDARRDDVRPLPDAGVLRAAAS